MQKYEKSELDQIPKTTERVDDRIAIAKKYTPLLKSCWDMNNQLDRDIFTMVYVTECGKSICKEFYLKNDNDVKKACTELFKIEQGLREGMSVLMSLTGCDSKIAREYELKHKHKFDSTYQACFDIKKTFKDEKWLKK